MMPILLCIFLHILTFRRLYVQAEMRSHIRFYAYRRVISTFDQRYPGLFHIYTRSTVVGNQTRWQTDTLSQIVNNRYQTRAVLCPRGVNIFSYTVRNRYTYPHITNNIHVHSNLMTKLNILRYIEKWLWSGPGPYDPLLEACPDFRYDAFIPCLRIPHDSNVRRLCQWLVVECPFRCF